MRDYKLIAKRQEVEQAIAKQNAIISAIHNGDLTKAEFLTGQQLIPTNPVVEGLLKKKKSEEVTNREILNELRAIKEKPDFDYDALSQALKYEDEQEAIDANKGLLLNLDKDFDEDDIVRLTYYKLPIPSELYSSHHETLVSNVQDNITKVKKLKELPEIKNAKRGFLPKNDPIKRKRAIELRKHRDVLDKYFKRLKLINDGFELQKGSSIMTNMVDLVDRFKLLVGEIESGNTNKALKNELADLLQYLFRSKKLTKTQYKMFSNLIQ